MGCDPRFMVENEGEKNVIFIPHIHGKTIHRMTGGLLGG
jgi:hypothetical protein